jgi:hypothetical protein
MVLTNTFSEPPKWVTEPRNAFAILGSSLSVDCLADGFPAPNISWKRSHGEYKSTRHENPYREPENFF